jgi:hypothetical protein
MFTPGSGWFITDSPGRDSGAGACCTLTMVVGAGGGVGLELELLLPLPLPLLVILLVLLDGRIVVTSMGTRCGDVDRLRDSDRRRTLGGGTTVGRSSYSCTDEGR